MRLVLLATAACLLGGSACAQSLLGQSEPGGPRPLLPAPAPAHSAALGSPPEMVQKPSMPPKITPVATPAPITQTTLPPPEMRPKPTKLPNASPAPVSAPSQLVSPPKSSPVPSVPGGASGAGTAVSPSITTPLPAPVATAQPANDVAPPPETAWVSARTAEIAVLNKVEGSTQTMMIPVGGQAQAGDLTISVQACVLRPAGALPNAAVYLTLRSTTQADVPPAYQGWVVYSMPGATDAENADEAVRLVGCS